LFVLTTLFTQPEAFDTYVAADPAIHVGGYELIRRWPELSQLRFPDRPRHLLLLRGSVPEGPEVDRFAKKAGIPLPPDPALARPAPPNPYVRTQSGFAQMMRSIQGVQTTFVELPGETHQSMIPAYLGRGMRWTLMRWDPP
jgi:predicted alpha/beta superfamily hydrolase